MPMFGFISWLLSNPDTSYYFSKHHHAGACCIAFGSIVVIAAILFSSISKLCQTLRQMKETRRGLAGIICLGIIAAMLSWGSVDYVLIRLQPVPVFHPKQQTTFVRDPVELTWTFSGKAENPNEQIVYEVEAGDKQEFDPHDRLFPADSTSFYPHEKANERWWRVRAIVDGTPTPWSAPIHTVRYENALERIKSTGTLVIGVSSDTSQGIFKFLAGKDPAGVDREAGVDIELVKQIAKHLESILNRDIRIIYNPKSWESVFQPIQDGTADIVVAAVSKLRSREEYYKIRFSDGYFCTGKSLLYSTASGFNPVECKPSAGKCTAPVMSRLNGGVVGYGRKTATAELLDKLRGKNVTFTTRAFAEVDIPVRKLLASRSEIQFAMTDTAFAEARVLEDDSDKLASVRLCDCDYPDPKNPFDEYAVAVEQSETELLNAVNDTIRVLKSDKINGLDQILEDAATKRFPKVAKEKLRPLYKSECSGDPTKEPERTAANAL